MIIVGIEEAGRGPVIGPMVMCAIAVSSEDEMKLFNIGVKDSKLLTSKKRKELFDQIKKIARGISLRVIPPNDVDDAITSARFNLNWLEALKSCEMIDELSEKMKIDRVIIDCPSPNLTSYRNFISKHIKNKQVDIICEHKADLNYVIVAAASVIAKVTRDITIEEIKKRYNIDFGSGYASDPKTQDFLKNNHDKYDFFRKKWATYKLVDNQKKQKKLFDFDKP